MSKKVRIGLLDSDPDIRYGRRMILSSESNYEIVLDSDGGTFDLGLVAESLIDVLVLDQRLGSGPGIDFYSKLRTLTGLKQAPSAVLTASYKQTALELEALEHGVFATISLETGAEGLLEATAFAAEGKAPLSLLDVFQIERKVGLKGLKFINLTAPKDASFRKITVTIPHLIDEVMDKFHATSDQKKEAMDIYSKLKDRSSVLNRSRPQSLASAIVRYYIQQKNNEITMEYFLSRVNLSELTIMRLVNEIHTLLDTEIRR
jgi:DNA-binding NarL/FixJ family response regulator